VQLLGTELSVNLLNDPMFRFGPAVNYRFGRKDSVHDVVVKQMTELKDTVEAGAFVGAVFADAKDPRQRFVLNLEYLHDVGGHYKGGNFTLSGRYWIPISRPIDVSLGASATYADSKYMNYYFSVTPQNVGTSGLPLFDASGGTRDLSISPAVVYHFSKEWHLGIGARYQRLVGDAKDSPVVAIRGSANQVIAGLAAIYSW